MNFRTELTPGQFPFSINYDSTIISVGSCFADMVGERLIKYKFKTLSNPFGNIFNPVSVHKVLNVNTDFTTNCVENNGIWYSCDLHSEIFGNSRNELLEIIEKKQTETQTFLQNASTIIITYGTAWVYELKDSKSIVANCHKLPQTLFEKRLLSAMEIEISFDALLSSLQNKENLNIVLTVSPVRHVKDTLELNGVSKSILRVACHHLASKYSNVHYFPSYELMMDDLRDYRFYKKDMIHPSEVAEDYIWKKFSSGLIDNNAFGLLKSIDEVNSAMNHKPFQPESESHQQFVKSQIKKISEIEAPISFETELDFFQNKLWR